MGAEVAKVLAVPTDDGSPPDMLAAFTAVLAGLEGGGPQVDLC
jgi:hypothetical protein